MRFNKYSSLKKGTPNTYDELPDLEEYTVEEFKKLPESVRRALILKAAPPADRG